MPYTEYEYPFYRFWTANALSMASKYACSRAEKERLVPLVRTVEALVQKARSEGLLSIEEDLASLDWPLLREGLSAVVNGWDLADAVFLVSARAFASSEAPRGAALLEILVTALAVQHLSCATNPAVISAHIAALFGEDGDLVRRDAELADVQKENEDALARIIKSAQSGERDEAFEQLLKRLDDISVIRLFREVRVEELALALRSCADEAAWRKILGNMGARGAADFLALIDSIHAKHPAGAVAAARAKITAVLGAMKPWKPLSERL